MTTTNNRPYLRTTRYAGESISGKGSWVLSLFLNFQFIYYTNSLLEPPTLPESHFPLTTRVQPHVHPLTSCSPSLRVRGLTLSHHVYTPPTTPLPTLKFLHPSYERGRPKFTLPTTQSSRCSQVTTCIAWRSPMFDRALIRFYLKWMVSRERSVKKVWERVWRGWI